MSLKNIQYEISEFEKLLNILEDDHKFKPCQITIQFSNGHAISARIKNIDGKKVEIKNPPSYEYLREKVEYLQKQISQYELHKRNKFWFF